MEFNNFYEAFQFLDGHPIYIGTFMRGLSVDVVKVNPETNAVDDEPDNNTLVQVWLESGPFQYMGALHEYMHTHDIRLDCGGNTFEEAIVKMAKLVEIHYGTYTEEDQEKASQKWYDWLSSTG